MGYSTYIYLGNDMWFSAFFSFISGVSDANPHLNRARLVAISRHAPVIYVIVIVGSIAVAITHADVAPAYLTFGVSGVLITLAILRIARHLLVKVKELPDAKVALRLRLSFVFTNFFSVAFASWCMTLYNYGDVDTQTQIIYFTGVTTFGCAACLMHQRSMALSVIFSTTIPMSIFLASVGGDAHLAIVMNMVLVSIAVMFVLSSFSENFADLIAHQHALIDKQAETQRLSDANMRLANVDSLTELPNRRSYFSELRSMLQSALTYNTGLAVGVLDLDGFKPINDVYGHPVGDRVLLSVSERLSEMTEENVFVARLGGDEFGLIVEGDYSDTELLELGDRICGLVKTPFEIDGVVAQMSASVGLVRLSDDAKTSEQLFERADYALYHAKQSVIGGAVLFSDEHEAKIREVSGIERHLRDADFEQEMDLAFQPIIDLESGKPVGFEALARWNSPKLGRVPPSAFIEAAERAGLINTLTEVLLEKALYAAASWPDDLYLSFNLSSRDIGSPQCMLRILGIIERSGVSPKRLNFEVTETAVLKDFDAARETLNLLKNLGVSIALDDFGTGYSSLSYVRNLPLDQLKVDRSFITEIGTDEMARAVVRTMLDLCRNLELVCIMEGVETEQQLAILREMECARSQGFYFSKPMQAEDIDGYLSDQSDVRASA